jgi:hypothetical protein
MDLLPLEVQYVILSAAPHELLQLMALVSKTWQGFCAGRAPSPTRDAVLLLFVRERDKKLLLWSRDGGRKCPPALCAEAAARGDQEMIEWLRAEGAPWDKEAPTSAARGGHLGILQWLLEHRCPRNSMPFVEAAANGDIQMMEWLEKQDLGGGAVLAPVRAASAGKIEALAWLCDKGYTLSERVICSAAGAGHCHVLQWLHDAGIVWEDKPFEWDCPYQSSAVNGHVEAMRWLFDHGCPIIDARGAKEMAASQGHLAALQWLMENTKSETWEPIALLSCAISNGRLNVLEWLCAARGYRTGKRECCLARSAAARGGHKGIVRWLHESGRCKCGAGRALLESETA